jgi:hypothetical protein
MNNQVVYDEIYREVEANECSFTRCTFIGYCAFSMCEFYDCMMSDASGVMVNCILANTPVAPQYITLQSCDRYSDQDWNDMIRQLEHAQENQPSTSVPHITRRQNTTSRTPTTRQRRPRRGAREPRKPPRSELIELAPGWNGRIDTQVQTGCRLSPNPVYCDENTWYKAHNRGVYSKSIRIGTLLFSNSEAGQRVHLSKHGWVTCVTHRGDLLVNGILCRDFAAMAALEEPPSRNTQEVVDVDAYSSRPVLPPPTTTTATNDTNDVAPDNGRGTCVICFDAVVNCVFLPCKHAQCCLQCYDMLEYPKLCPSCRTPINEAMQIYFS